MFVDHAAVLKVSYPVAKAGLKRLARGPWFSGASEDAYSDGLAGLIRVGPFGDVPGASKLVRVLLLDPTERGDSVMLPLRWEATGVMGRLFPVLDANLTLTPADGETTRLTLNGVYRPPLSGVGAGLDRALLHRTADATVRSLVRELVSVLEALDTAGSPPRAPEPPPDPGLAVAREAGTEPGPPG